MKAVRKESVVAVNGVPVGLSIEVEHIEGEPDFGKCYGVDCIEKATDETLIGLHFCEAHFLKFYSEEDFDWTVPT